MMRKVESVLAWAPAWGPLLVLAAIVMNPHISRHQIVLDGSVRTVGVNTRHQTVSFSRSFASSSTLYIENGVVKERFLFCAPRGCGWKIERASAGHTEVWQDLFGTKST